MREIITSYIANARQDAKNVKLSKITCQNVLDVVLYLSMRNIIDKLYVVAIRKGGIVLKKTAIYSTCIGAITVVIASSASTCNWLVGMKNR